MHQADLDGFGLRAQQGRHAERGGRGGSGADEAAAGETVLADGHVPS